MRRAALVLLVLALPVPAAAGVRVPREVAAGGQLTVQLNGVKLPAQLQVRLQGRPWRTLRIKRRARATRLRVPLRPQGMRFRARDANGKLTRVRRVRVRFLRLSAVGDVNLGDGPGAEIAVHGPEYLWESVGARLRAADLAIANLECAVSFRGSAEPKTFTFRGGPAALRATAEEGGIDIVTLANNHAGDFGDVALRDTLRYTRQFGIATVGAGRDSAQAYRPRIMNRLGLKVAFVAFSTILPFDFVAGPSDPGTAWGFPNKVRSSVLRAKRHADVVIPYFHWGIERDPVQDAREEGLAQVALDAGATAVIGAHPHNLQPIQPVGRHRLVAYSLGNFVFTGTSAFTRRTGILELRLARGRVAAHKLRRATIVNSQPRL